MYVNPNRRAKEDALAIMAAGGVIEDANVLNFGGIKEEVSAMKAAEEVKEDKIAHKSAEDSTILKAAVEVKDIESKVSAKESIPGTTDDALIKTSPDTSAATTTTTNEVKANPSIDATQKPKIQSRRPKRFAKYTTMTPIDNNAALHIYRDCPVNLRINVISNPLLNAKVFAKYVALRVEETSLSNVFKDVLKMM